MVKKPKNKPDFPFSDQDRQAWEYFSNTVKAKKDARDDDDFFEETHPPNKQGKPRPSPPPVGGAKLPVIKKMAMLPPLVIGNPGGISAADFRKLTRGKIAIESRLDLHACTRDAAWVELKTWLPACREQGKRCVLVVTGKGTGALKAALPEYINRPELRAHILCCTPAAPKDGGGGAFYVYLKRK